MCQLRYENDLKPAAIADVLKMTPNAVANGASAHSRTTSTVYQRHVAIEEHDHDLPAAAPAACSTMQRKPYKKITQCQVPREYIDGYFDDSLSFRTTKGNCANGFNQIQ